MKKIVVEIKPCKLKNRVDLIFDDATCMNVTREILEQADIQIMKEIELDHLDGIINTLEYQRGLEAALNYMEYRPRSESEISQYLRIKQRLSEETSILIINKLKAMQLIDDKAFAEIWMRDRISFKPKSRLMITRELLQKGIDYDIARKVTDVVDDEESAYRAGMKKARLLKKVDYAEFRKRLIAYLARRGFSGDIVNLAVSKLWQYICDNQ